MQARCLRHTGAENHGGRRTRFFVPEIPDEPNLALDTESRVRELTEEWMKALCRKDVDGMLAHYAPGVVFFDVKPPLRDWGWWRIENSGEFVYHDSQVRLNTKSTSGGTIDFFLRVTVCFRKIDGEWTVTHEHASAPFDPMTMQAGMDLEPKKVAARCPERASWIVVRSIRGGARPIATKTQTPKEAE